MRYIFFRDITVWLNPMAANVSSNTPTMAMVSTLLSKRMAMPLLHTNQLMLLRLTMLLNIRHHTARIRPTSRPTARTKKVRSGSLCNLVLNVTFPRWTNEFRCLLYFCEPFFVLRLFIKRFSFEFREILFKISLSRWLFNAKF